MALISTVSTTDGTGRAGDARVSKGIRQSAFVMRKSAQVKEQSALVMGQSALVIGQSGLAMGRSALVMELSVGTGDGRISTNDETMSTVDGTNSTDERTARVLLRDEPACLFRFCSQTFKLEDFHESIHLCNNAVQVEATSQ